MYSLSALLLFRTYVIHSVRGNMCFSKECPNNASFYGVAELAFFQLHPVHSFHRYQFLKLVYVVSLYHLLANEL